MGIVLLVSLWSSCFGRCWIPSLRNVANINSLQLGYGTHFAFEVPSCELTNISPFKGTFEDDFPFPKVGYVSSLDSMLGNF